jgi:hypothetical protein
MSATIIPLRPHYYNLSLRLKNERLLAPPPIPYPTNSGYEWTQADPSDLQQAKYEALPTPPSS